jgi:hypothetical protein
VQILKLWEVATSPNFLKIMDPKNYFAAKHGRWNDFYRENRLNREK